MALSTLASMAGLAHAASTHFLGLVTLYKNEAHVLNEFLQHYTAQGVDRWWLIDNASTDCSAHVVSQFFARSNATASLMTVPAQGKIQSTAYKAVFAEARATTTWLLVLDADEFLYATSGTIASQLRPKPARFADVLQICVPWRVFGSEGRAAQPRCVVQSLTHRAHDWSEWISLYFHCKAKERAAKQERRAFPACDFSRYHSHANFITGKCILHMRNAAVIKAHMHMGQGATLCEDMKTRTGQSRGPPCLKTKCMQVAHAFKQCLRKVPFLKTKPVFRLNHYKFQSDAFMHVIKAGRKRISGNTHFDALAEYHKLYNITNDRRDTALKKLGLTSCTDEGDVELPVTCGDDAAADRGPAGDASTPQA